MTAAVLYGSENLKIENVDIPTLAPDEALIRVKVALTCGTDLKVWKRGDNAQNTRFPGRIVRQNMRVIPEHVSFQDAAMVEPLACVLRGIHETGIQQGDTTVVIGCGPIGLKFIRVLAGRGVNVIALGKRPNQVRAAERAGARAALIATDLSDPAKAVRDLTEGGRGADSVIEAVGTPKTWEWALQMVRRGGTVNLFGGCSRGTAVQVDPHAVDYSEIQNKSNIHHTPRFIREALEAIARGEIRSSDFVNAEIRLTELPKMFEHMKYRNGEIKVAVIP